MKVVRMLSIPGPFASNRRRRRKKERRTDIMISIHSVLSESPPSSGTKDREWRTDNRIGEFRLNVCLRTPDIVLDVCFGDSKVNLSRLEEF